MSVANGKFPFSIVDSTYDQVILTTSSTGFGKISSNNEKGIKYNYESETLKIKKLDVREGKQFKPFPDYVKGFWEFSDKENFTYDYSGNKNDFVNKSAMWTDKGAYFSTNEDVRYKTQYQNDVRRMEIKSDKINSIIKALDTNYSISFDFCPLENDSTLFHLRSNTPAGKDTYLVIKINVNKLVIEAKVGGVTYYTGTSNVDVTYGKRSHFCLSSDGTQTRIYYDNVLVRTFTSSFDINNHTYDSLTLGAMRYNDADRYYLPYAGWIGYLMITNGELSSSDRNAIYNNDYGYDIIILAGQSNMFGIAKIQEGIDNDYSEIAGKVFQYDWNTDSIIAATNQLKHYQGGVVANTMGGWLEFVKRYVKYHKKASSRKVLLVPCAYPGSTFASMWNPEGEMYGHLVENTNKCVGYSKLNKITGMIWYQGEGEAGTANANYKSDLETFRQGMLKDINGFTESTPMVVTLINNKNVISTTIEGIPGNEYVNKTMVEFAGKYGYGIVKTEDLKMMDDWVHMTAESLRTIGKRWYYEFCKITGIVNKDIAAIHSDVKVDLKEAIVEKLDVQKLNIIYDNSCDIDLESYVPMRTNVGVSTPINIRVHKAMYQPKTDDIWLLPNAISEKTIKYWNVKTKKLVERSDWPSLSFSGYACCMYKDKLYVLDNNHNDSAVNDAVLADNILYIIDTLNYTIEVVNGLVKKTSGVGSSWTAPAGSSSNVTQTVMSAITYCALFPYNDKIYFIPMAQQEVAIYDIATKTLDQDTLDVGVNIMGMYGATYNPSNKCLYLSRAYKIGSAGWDIPYLNFNNSPPTIAYATLPSEFVAYRYGCYCFSNNCVYIPVSTHDNGDDAVLLKIKPNHTIVGLTLSNFTKSKQFNSILYSPDNRILLCQSSGTVTRVVPDLVGDNESTEGSITITGGRFIQCFDKYGCLYSFNNTTASAFGVTRLPITMDNKEIFNPIFNCLH